MHNGCENEMCRIAVEEENSGTAREEHGENPWSSVNAKHAATYLSSKTG